jgi:hypothetical protein
MSRPPIFLACLLLLGCLAGGPFYTVSDARPAIAPGDYRLTGQVPQGGPEILRVSRLPDGRTRFVPPDRPEEPLDAGFTPLDDEGRFFIAWSTPRPSAETGTQSYALAARESRGAWRFYLGFCEGLDDIARSVGARVVPEGRTTACLFPERAGFERFMRRAIARRARMRPRSALLTPVAAP